MSSTKTKFITSISSAVTLLFLGACGGGDGSSNSATTASSQTPLQVSSASFEHPGILETQARLDYVKAQIAAKNAVFVGAFDALQSSQWASKTYAIQGTLDGGYIACDSTSSNDHGCTAEQNDSTAAYTQALMWYLTGDQTYAKNAISIMNTYSSKLTGGHGGTNAPLQSAWAAEVWPAAAEIIRYTYKGWATTDVQAFATMLKTQHLPYITGTNGDGNNGNWKLSMIDGMIGIAVFTEDHTLFNNAVALWKKWVPAYYYNASIDGSTPVTFPGSPVNSDGSMKWNGQAVFNTATSGVTQETCRDTQHVGLAMAATFNAAETAYIQGTDLYVVEQTRLITSLEFLSKLLYGTRNTSQTNYTAVPSYLNGSLCTSVAAPNANMYVPVLKGTMVRAYNAYATRKGLALPETLKHVRDDIIPAAIPDDAHDVQWEVLTHGGSAATPTE
jgi:hypothetical protein